MADIPAKNASCIAEHHEDFDGKRKTFHDPDWWCYTTVPFVGPAIDTLGRRIGMWIGASITIMGVTIQGTIVDTNNVSQFMGGRIFMAMGVSIIASAGRC
ncbi:hypothetical protein B2J93_6450 [Marssonina coronariae]|uniref:Major facilitator superfamily (MFS) profile domain-containing protein n=1 Tax=Diplocarpon coronariae TaxID=2795749 RepID=A0A218Z3N1_9HELO|nr:hypothetical protein B2J93_6450 [Marssonina coronariae]